MEAQGARQRRYPRIASENAVLVKRLGDGALEEFARTRTMGLGGCCFLSHESLGIGSLVEILISVRLKVVKARARVVYEKPMGGSTEVGVEFVQLPPEDRLVIEGLFVGQPVRPAASRSPSSPALSPSASACGVAPRQAWIVDATCPVAP